MATNVYLRDFNLTQAVHDEEVWRGDEAGHQFGVYVCEAVRVLETPGVAQDTWPRSARHTELNSLPYAPPQGSQAARCRGRTVFSVHLHNPTASKQ